MLHVESIKNCVFLTLQPTARTFMLVAIADISLFFVSVLPWLLNAQPTFMTRNSMVCPHTSTFFGVTLTTFGPKSPGG